MKKFIIPLVIIFVVILSIIIFASINNNDTPVVDPSDVQTEIPEQQKENKTAVSVYEEYNVEPGSYEAYLLDMYSGDNSNSGEDLDGDGIPDRLLETL